MRSTTSQQSGDSAVRRCSNCHELLASDNSATQCGKCLREMSGELRTPPAHPEEFFEWGELKAAFESQHIGKVFKAYRNHPRHVEVFGKTLNQNLLGRWLGLTQAQVSKLENGKPEHNLETLRHYAKTLHLPQRLLWFDLSRQSRLSRSKPSLIEDGVITPPRVLLPDSSETITGSLLTDSLFFDEGFIPKEAMASIVRDTVADLMAMDFKRGGGHTRRMLMYYFQNEVAPLLSWRYSDTRLRNDIYSAVAEALQLLGWSAYDAGSHSSARQYFGHAVRLATEADDVLLAGRVLANLSHQANFLGHFGEALKFAREAQDIAGPKAPNTVASMFFAMEARALASLGDKPGMIKALHTAEQLHESRNPEKDPAWISYFNAQEIASEAAHCFMVLGQARSCVEFAMLSMDPLHTPPRTLSFMRMVAASGSLAGGDLDNAVALASEAIESGSSLQSARYVKYILDFYLALTDKDAGLGAQMADLLHTHYPRLIIPS